jgi:hypothetical protein
MCSDENEAETVPGIDQFISGSIVAVVHQPEPVVSPDV